MSEDESRRILRRLENEQEKLLHPRSEDAGDDPIEKLGKRIARVLGGAVLVFVLWYLWTQIRG